MQLDRNADGLIHLSLEHDEQVIVTIGGAEVWCTGGIISAPIEGPLVHMILQEPTVRLEMKHFTPP